MFINAIKSIMVSVLGSSDVGRGFGSQSGQTKHFKIGIRCFFVKIIRI